MNKNSICKEELEEYAQIVFTIVGTEGAIEEEFKIYNKDELIEYLNKVLPNKFRFSIIFALNPGEIGI